MRDLFMKERVVKTDYDTYRLRYNMHQMDDGDEDLYGVSISQYNNHERRAKLFDQAVITAFSESMKEAEAFFDTLYKEIVFPAHLYSVADDWYEEFHN